MCNNSCRNPIYCIIGPDMIKNLKVRGSKYQKTLAKDLETVSKNYREQRDALISSTAIHSGATNVGKVKKSKPKSLTGVTIHREVYDAKKNKLIRKEGQAPVRDDEVNSAFDFAGIIHDFFLGVFGRDSIDGKGSKLISEVRFRKNKRRKFYNAFWDKDRLKYGEGDKKIFNSFATDLSISAHEHVHGVIQHSGGLIYEDEAGALNESLADVFASMILQYSKNQRVHDASWLIGEDVLRGDDTGALRSLKAPGTAYDHPLLGKDRQPFHMNGFVRTASDNGGVHLNSGIPNHAFYLLCMMVGGFSWERAGKIWYNSLIMIDNSLMRFDEFAALTVQEAISLFGSSSLEALHTKRAWSLVGINVF